MAENHTWRDHYVEFCVRAVCGTKPDLRHGPGPYGTCIESGPTELVVYDIERRLPIEVIPYRFTAIMAKNTSSGAFA